MREEAHRVAPSLTVHGPRPRTISKRQEEMFFWPPEHRRKTTESGVFSASRRQPNMSPLERATHNGTTAVRGPDGAGGAVNGGEESRASSPAPQRRTAEGGEGKVGGPGCSALPVAAPVSRPLPP